MATSTPLVSSKASADVSIESCDRERVQCFRDELDRLKQELRDEFDRLYQLLRKEETRLLEILENRLDGVNALVAQRDARVEQLKRGREELEHGLAHNDLSQLLGEARDKINREIRKLVREDKFDLPAISLQWELTELNALIPKVCNIDEVTHPYTYKCRPVMSCVSNGDKGGLMKPRGLAIGGDGRVFVADYTKSQIEVYSPEGAHCRSLGDRKLREPLYLCMSGEYLYVSCENRCLLKFDVKSGDKVRECMVPLTVSGLCIENDGTLLGCVWKKSCVYRFSAELEKEGELPLNTQHYKLGVTITADVRISNKQEMIVLFYKSAYPVQVFSREGTLLVCLLSQEQVGGALYFCIDGGDNLLVSDIGTHQVKVFTPQGELLVRIGRKGQEAGEFQTPVGLAVTPSGDIVVCDCKQEYMLQAF